jgi:hypothetical protein
MSDDPLRWWEIEINDGQRWRELVEPALERLLRARDRDRLPHALLLVGPAGLGRELAAAEAAVLLVCEGVEGPWSESRCGARVREGLHPDVEAVLPTGAKQIIKIDQIRNIVKSAPSRPYEGLRRVWILDGVEAGYFGAEAANAFLKVLEEPPEHVIFILLAANPMAVLPTIRSRCQQLTLPGSVAVARRRAEDRPLPELPMAILATEDLGDAVEMIRDCLEAGLKRRTRRLLRLPYAVPANLPPLSATAAVAVEMACEAEDDTAGEDLIRLAADLLSVERRARALNLNPKGQMVSSLLRWYRELPRS